MSTSVELPALGESVTEGTVSTWLKQVGDTVEADEALVEVSTDKVDTEIPSPVAGTLLEIKVQEDETVDVGTVLCVVGDADEGSSDDDASDADAGSAEDPQSADSDAEEATEQDKDDESDSEPEDTSSGSSGSGESKPSGGSASGTEVKLPALGESVTEGTVSTWLKEVGDEVEADEALVEVSTDKVDTEIPSPEAGTLLEIRVQEDETVEVGTVLCIIGDASQAPSGDASGDDKGEEAAPAEEPAAEEKAEPKKDDKPKDAEPKSDDKAEAAKSTSQEKPENAKPAPKAAPRAGGEEGAYVTPLVRKLAGQHGVDLSSLEGTGVGGRIRKQDVLNAADKTKRDAEQAEKDAAQAQKDAEQATKDASAAKGSPQQPAKAKPSASAAPSADAQAKRGTTEKMSRLRATIAKRMVESLQVSAQLTATVEVDLTAISRLRAQAKVEFAKREGAKLSYLPFIATAAVEALKQFPKVNATIDTDAGTITYAGSENLGIAVDTEKGLMVPVIKEAGDLNLAGMARKISDLAERTRTNKVTPDDLTGGTFTITNYGSAGTLMDSPIINQPQVAILGTGALVKRAMVVADERLGDTIAIRDMMYISMSYDHRLVDGADAARFLGVVKARLEAGDFTAELGL